MNTSLLSTKLYIPPSRPKIVHRTELIERMNKGLHRKLTLVSASAGFGKTTLVSQWLAGGKRPVAWVSLDEGDNDPTRFLTYLLTALQTIGANIGEGVFGALRSQQPPIESILTATLNELAHIQDDFLLVLDDYHVIEANSIDHAITFLLENMPPQMHLVISTREAPLFPLAKLRVRDQLTELHVADLRFTLSEVSGFLNEVMGLNLSSDNIALLETRTEGWIAGLQLAAISMQGHQDTTSFIQSFTGSHRYVLDYLLEEVLEKQSESVQAFLLHTSILDRMCGSLCDAVMNVDCQSSGQDTLAMIEKANLFILPLDNERRWYRYHHLFAQLLRQRLHQLTSTSIGDKGSPVNELHKRASLWYEGEGLLTEAFHHAAASNDVEHAVRLMEGDGLPLHFRGVMAPILNWLNSLPSIVLDHRPSMWVIYASISLMAGQLNSVEQKLQAAEAALQGVEPDDKIKDLIGHIASIRASLAVSQHQVDIILTQSHRALEYLHPGNLPIRTATIWTLGYAYQLQGNRVAASRAYTEALSISEAIGHVLISLMAAIGLGGIQESENQLDLATETYWHVLQQAGDPPLPVACEAHLGLARIFYERNDLVAAEQHAQLSVQLARQIESTDRFVASEVFVARLKLTKGDMAGAVATLSKAGQHVRQHHFVHQFAEVASVQVMAMLRQGNIEEAAHLVEMYDLPITEARVCLAQGATSAALMILESYRKKVEEQGWEDQRLQTIVLQVVTLHALGNKVGAIQQLAEALRLAEPSGFIRIFVDEGPLMEELLSIAVAQGIMPNYIGKLLAVYDAEKKKEARQSIMSTTPLTPPLIEPLSKRELEVLQLIAQGLSNHEISERLFLALSSVKGHNRNIFDKLQVQRRTEAVARARELRLL